MGLKARFELVQFGWFDHLDMHTETSALCHVLLCGAGGLVAGVEIKSALRA
jgi:hypothetical protein